MQQGPQTITWWNVNLTSKNEKKNIKWQPPTTLHSYIFKIMKNLKNEHQKQEKK